MNERTKVHAPTPLFIYSFINKNNDTKNLEFCRTKYLVERKFKTILFMIIFVMDHNCVNF